MRLKKEATCDFADVVRALPLADVGWLGGDAGFVATPAMPSPHSKTVFDCPRLSNTTEAQKTLQIRIWHPVAGGHLRLEVLACGLCVGLSLGGLPFAKPKVIPQRHLSRTLRHEWVLGVCLGQHPVISERLRLFENRLRRDLKVRIGEAVEYGGVQIPECQTSLADQEVLEALGRVVSAKDLNLSSTSPAATKHSQKKSPCLTPAGAQPVI